MRIDFLTDEERLYLEENLNDVIALFNQTFNEIKIELKEIYNKKGHLNHDSYYFFKIGQVNISLIQVIVSILQE